MKKLLVLVMVLLAGCTQQMRAKHWGGQIDENLPPGMKLVNVTWEEQNLWYVLRPMKPGEVPETYTIHESSSWGVLQGNIIAHEQR